MTPPSKPSPYVQIWDKVFTSSLLVLSNHFPPTFLRTKQNNTHTQKETKTYPFLKLYTNWTTVPYCGCKLLNLKRFCFIYWRSELLITISHVLPFLILGNFNRHLKIHTTVQTQFCFVIYIFFNISLSIIFYCKLFLKLCHCQ